MSIQRGVKIEILSADRSTDTVLTWDLPPMSKKFGIPATQHSFAWKKIHAQSEQVYETFRVAHIEMIRKHERRDVNGGQDITPLIERAVSKFRQFTNDIQDLPAEVSQAEHLTALQNAEKGFSALFWHLANSQPGTDEFNEAVVFVERLCTWSFETLSRADKILEKYFEIEAAKT
jgi:hypothetical protein